MIKGYILALFQTHYLVGLKISLEKALGLSVGFEAFKTKEESFAISTSWTFNDKIILRK